MCLEYLGVVLDSSQMQARLPLDKVSRIIGFIETLLSASSFPLRRTEADIWNIYSHYGDIFYQYNVQCSKQVAVYLGKGIKAIVCCHM